MEEVAIDVRKTQELAFSQRIKAYFELTKPRIAFMLVLTAAVAFYLGSDQFNFVLFFKSIIGITLLAFGTATLNQFLERKIDAVMQRTASRPLPSKRINATEALVFGILLCAGAELTLFYFVNTLTGVLGLLVIFGYLFLYTPLKRITTFSTVIGAFPGAMPPLMGWAAATNEISLQAWIMFSMIFFWQFPHFLAIAWVYREDYKKAGIKMLPVVEENGKITAQQVVFFTILLFLTSLMPFFLGMAGWVYLIAALLLGSYFLYFAVCMARQKSILAARKVLLASVVYLPIVFALLVLNS